METKNKKIVAKTFAVIYQDALKVLPNNNALKKYNIPVPNPLENHSGRSIIVKGINITNHTKYNFIFLFIYLSKALFCEAKSLPFIPLKNKNELITKKIGTAILNHGYNNEGSISAWIATTKKDNINFVMSKISYFLLII